MPCKNVLASFFASCLTGCMAQIEPCRQLENDVINVDTDGTIAEDGFVGPVIVDATLRRWNISNVDSSVRVILDYSVDVPVPTAESISMDAFEGDHPSFSFRAADGSILLQLADTSSPRPGLAVSLGEPVGSCTRDSADVNGIVDKNSVLFLWDEPTQASAVDIVDGTIGGRPVRGQALTEDFPPWGLMFAL